MDDIRFLVKDIKKRIEKKQSLPDFFTLLRYIESKYPKKTKLGYALNYEDEIIRFSQVPHLKFAESEIADIDIKDDKVLLKVYFFGLLGPNSVMPLEFTNFVMNRSFNHQDKGIQSFLDIINHRMISLYYKAKSVNNQTLSFSKEEDNFYDLSDTFPSPFYKGYWKGSLGFVKDVRKITITAMLFALMLVSKLLVLPSGFANLGLSFGFIFFSLITALFGPIAGLVIGFFSDTIGFFLFDTSGTGFFIGYVIQAMFTGFIYGLFLYKSKISFPRILLMRLVIGIFSNVIIGGISWGIVAGYNMTQTLYYMLLFSLPKNLIYLIPQSLLLFAVFKLLMPVLSRFGLINKKIADQIKLI